MQCGGKAKQGTCGGPASTHLCRRRHGILPRRCAAHNMLNNLPVRTASSHLHARHLQPKLCH